VRERSAHALEQRDGALCRRIARQQPPGDALVVQYKDDDGVNALD
jgi:hypothetical protein